MSSIAPLELDLALAACRAVVSLSTEWLTLKPAIFMTTKRHMCARRLPLPRHFLHRPDGTLRAPLFGLQGGGVYVDGVASFESCNIHDNTAYYVCLHL